MKLVFLQSQVLFNLIAWRISKAAQNATVVLTGFIGFLTMHTPMKLRRSLIRAGKRFNRMAKRARQK